MLADLQRRRHRAVLARGDAALDLFADDVVAQLDAFVADEDGRARNQLADLVLRLAAERTVEGALAVGARELGHKIPSRTALKSARPVLTRPPLIASFFILAPTPPITIWQLGDIGARSEEKTSELQSLMRISY